MILSMIDLNLLLQRNPMTGKLLVKKSSAAGFFAFFACNICLILHSYIAFGRMNRKYARSINVSGGILWMVRIDSTLHGFGDCSAKENKEWTKPGQLNPLLSVQQPNPPKWACPSFRSESAILPWPVNHARARAPKTATKLNAGTFSTENRQQKKLRGMSGINWKAWENYGGVGRN